MRYPFPIYDAHNHLHDRRLGSQLPLVIEALRDIPVRAMVVNGTRQEDWPQVADLAAKFDWVVPSIGLHPWWVKERRANWERDFLALMQKLL